VSYLNIRRFYQQLITTLFISSMLFSCASNKTSSRAPTNTQDINTQTADKSNTAAFFLFKAKNSQGEQAVDYLIQASRQFIIEQNLVKSLWLADQALPLAENDQQRYQLNLIKAENLTLLNKYQRALTALQQSQLVDENAKTSQLKYYQLLGLVQSARELPIIAVDAKLRAFALQKQSDEVDILSLWQALNKLSQWQIDQLVSLVPPNIKGWQQLLNFSHRFGYQTKSFNRYLAQWQRDFPQHPANVLINDLVSTVQIQKDVPTNIAIILPLSGKQKYAGEAAQQGILASYNNNQAKNLHFIDSNTFDINTLAKQLADLNIHSVIGPLLKPQVNAYIAQENITLPTLLLNLPTVGQLNTQHMVLSMDPKEEALQAATTLSRQTFEHPIIFSQNDNISKRIANTFANQWHKITSRLPEIVIFNDEAKTQAQLKNSLGVYKSQQRIEDIDKRIRQKIKTEARNRRDIDMIYLIGSPNETRLLKPYIDVSISPFARAIPIFASSRSHSDNADSSDSRDLTGLKFTEMPWLLTSKQQNQPLKQLNKAIWPDRSDSLQRIFAMGYDSLSLIDKFQQLKENNYIRHYGQTGVLKLNEQGILTRSLLWGNYRKDKVEEIAMD